MIDTLFTFETVFKGEAIHDTMIRDLLEERITGIIVKGFLSNEEVMSVLHTFNNIPDSKKTKVNDGFTSFPLSFAQFTQMKAAGLMTIEDYLQIAGDVMDEQRQRFGVDVLSKLCQLLEMTEVFETVRPIYNSDAGKPMVPFNFRELYPGNGELIVHCENLFFEEFPDFFNWLKLMDITNNKLSYFITLQEPDEGGELCCFDLNWNSVKYRENPTVVIDMDRNEIDVDSETVARQLIKPNEGDLLLFAGGNVWHRVEKVRGSKSRITLGGFVAETTEPGKYYIWS
ncbi:MAG: hypothetical protein GC178_03350 [Flavobacteriales bacterium]|nr:hypothetical protein [Flavobacteriales bacterium]